MEAPRALFHDVADRGPSNTSYGALCALLEEYTQEWDTLVDKKLKAERQQAIQKQDDEFWAEVRLRNRLSDAKA